MLVAEDLVEGVPNRAKTSQRPSRQAVRLLVQLFLHFESQVGHFALEHLVFYNWHWKSISEFHHSTVLCQIRSTGRVLTRFPRHFTNLSVHPGFLGKGNLLSFGKTYRHLQEALAVLDLMRKSQTVFGDSVDAPEVSVEEGRPLGRV